MFNLTTTMTSSTELDNSSSDAVLHASSTPGDPASVSATSSWLDARALVYRVGSFVLVPLGTVCNILVIVVLRRIGTESSTMPLFFTALAVSDLFILYFGLLPVGIEIQFGYSIQSSHAVVCKVIYWGFYSFGWLSAWLLVAMTIQRAASVVWPHKVSSTCTRRQAHVTIAIMVATVFVINANLLYGLDIHPQFGICFFTDTYINVFLEAFLWLDLMNSSILPFGILLLSNSVLVWKVLQSIRAARARLQSGQAEQMEARQRKFLSMSVTLIVVSATFIVLTGPIGLLSITTQDDMLDDFLMYVGAIMNLLWYTNSTINFFLYILTGTRFRQELKSLCGIGLKASRGKQ